jgi:hypothetical protein
MIYKQALQDLCPRGILHVTRRTDHHLRGQGQFIENDGYGSVSSLKKAQPSSRSSVGIHTLFLRLIQCEVGALIN